MQKKANKEEELLSQKEFSHDVQIEKIFEKMNSEEHDTKESEKDNKNCILYIKKKLTKIKKNIDLNV